MVGLRQNIESLLGLLWFHRFEEQFIQILDSRMIKILWILLRNLFPVFILSLLLLPNWHFHFSCSEVKKLNILNTSEEYFDKAIEIFREILYRCQFEEVVFPNAPVLVAVHVFHH